MTNIEIGITHRIRIENSRSLLVIRDVLACRE